MDNLPVVIRPKGVQKASEQERVEFADIFKSDSEDSDDESRFVWYHIPNYIFYIKQNITHDKISFGTEFFSRAKF